MPDTPVKKIATSAELELEDSFLLGGNLGEREDGSLLLADVRLLSGTAKEGKLSLRSGARARLICDAIDNGEAIAVQVANVTPSSVTLTIVNEDQAGDETDSRLTDHREDTSSLPLTGATAEYTSALELLRSESGTLLEKLMQPLLKDISDHLFELSAQSKKHGADETPYYEAMVDVRRHGKAFIADMVARVNELYIDLVPEDPDTLPWGDRVKSADDLDVVEFNKFEGDLALERLITRSDELYGRTVEALTIRLATLIDADPLAVRLPVHARQLGHIFEYTLVDRQFPSQVITHVLQFFALDCIGKLGDYYTKLNQVLIDAGILTLLEQDISSKGSLLKKKRQQKKAKRKKQKSESRADKTGDGATLAETASTQGQMVPSSQLPSLEKLLSNLEGNDSAGNIYKSIVDALNFQRYATGQALPPEAGTPVAGTWEGDAVTDKEVEQHSLADAQTIARVLGSLQRDSSVRNDLQQSGSMREYLASQKDSLTHLQDTTGLTAESLNQLDLVDNLFGTIKSQLDVTTELQPALGNLRIPFAKLALLDPNFFLDRQHTARSVVDRLSHLAASANFPNKALEKRIGDIVDSIVTDYETDGTVFDTALQQLERLSAQQERARAKNVERVVRTQEGQEKLRRARETVAQVINERINAPRAPAVLLDLVETGWRDLMVLTHVKQGPDSPAWQDHTRTLDLLVEWLNELQGDELDEDLLMQRALEAEPLIDMIEQQIASALPTQVSHEPVLNELRDILAGIKEVVSIDVSDRLPAPEPAAAEVRAKVEDLPRLRRWVHRVEQLELDSWLTYRDRENKRHRMRLAWISEDKDRYIFVNERGQKVAELSAIQLARQLSRGVQPPAPADNLSVVDQSLYETLEHAQKTLSFARNHDSLTKLINRDTFLDQMRRALRHAQLKDSQHAVLFLNIDKFSLVNEVYDRITGDQILLEFAKLLAQLHGRKSSSARLDGDQFAVLLLDRNLEQALHVANKIRTDIEAGSVDIEGEKVSFTVSIGVAAIRAYSPDVEQLMEFARAAMLHAKEQGRNRVQPYGEEQGDIRGYLDEKKRTMQDLEQAIATDRFLLRAQPIMQTAIDNSESVSLHYELLLGLTNQDGSLSSPEEFIGAAEKHGFMHLVDRWVVKEAFTWISELMDAQKVVPNLAINLSGTSVTDDSFMDYLLEQISEFGVGTSRICFEITETGTISNLVKAADFVRTFRNIGCKFSIDDFGTGLASHNYLRELPVDYVKIDGTFIKDIHNNRNDYAMAKSINDLAHFLGQETIAESVENDDIIETLREISVDYLQGWGIARPKPLPEITEDLSSIDK